MGNSSTSFLPAYNNCFSDDLSRDSFTPEYWDSHSINERFKISSIYTGVVFLLLFVVGLPSNLIVIYGIIRQRLYKEPTHMLLLNLAISDFLVCLLVMPLTIIASFSGSFIFGDSDHVRCRVCQTGFIYIWLTLVSLYTLGLLSIDRFIYIKFALYYNKYVTTMRVLLVIIVSWVANLIISLLPIMGFGEYRYGYSFSACTIDFFRSSANISYGILVIVFGLIPFIIILVCNIWIMFIVVKHIKQVYKTRASFRNRSENHQTLNKRIEKTKNRKQFILLRTFGAIIIANLAVWFSLFISLISFTIIDGNLIPTAVFASTYILNVLHAVLHPIIEGCLIPDFRQIIKKILLCQYPACSVERASSGSTSHDSGQVGSYSSAKPSCNCCDSCYVGCSAVLPDDPINNDGGL